MRKRAPETEDRKEIQVTTYRIATETFGINNPLSITFPLQVEALKRNGIVQSEEDVRQGAQNAYELALSLHETIRSMTPEDITGALLDVYPYILNEMQRQKASGEAVDPKTANAIIALGRTLLDPERSRTLAEQLQNAIITIGKNLKIPKNTKEDQGVQRNSGEIFARGLATAEGFVLPINPGDSKGQNAARYDTSPTNSPHQKEIKQLNLEKWLNFTGSGLGYILSTIALSSGISTYISIADTQAAINKAASTAIGIFGALMVQVTETAAILSTKKPTTADQWMLRTMLAIDGLTIFVGAGGHVNLLNLFPPNEATPHVVITQIVAIIGKAMLAYLGAAEAEHALKRGIERHQEIKDLLDQESLNIENQTVSYAHLRPDPAKMMRSGNN